MVKFDSPLANLKVASPCPADWDAMAGDARKRFCGDCKLHVYNLSGMTRYDAENLLRLSEGRLCVRYYQRSDGTVLTQDCPVGWAKVKQRVSVFAAAAFSLIVSVLGSFFVISSFTRKQAVVGQIAAEELQQLGIQITQIIAPTVGTNERANRHAALHQFPRHMTPDKPRSARY